MASFYAHYWIFLGRRVHNEMLCIQEYKAHFIVGDVEVVFICSGYSHYTLTSVKKNILKYIESTATSHLIEVLTHFL